MTARSAWKTVYRMARREARESWWRRPYILAVAGDSARACGFGSVRFVACAGRVRLMQDQPHRGAV